MTDTPNIDLTYMESGQSGGEVLFNGLANTLDSLMIKSVLSVANTGVETDGNVYIVGASPTGDFVGHSDAIAAYYGEWTFTSPVEGWLAYNQDDNKFYYWSGAAWTEWISGEGEITTYTTVTAAESASGTDNDLCFIVETESFYRYESAGSAYTDDDTFILSTGDAGDTRWLAISGQYTVGDVNINGALNEKTISISSDYGPADDWVFNQLHVDTTSADITVTFPVSLTPYPDGAKRLLINTGTGRIFVDPNGHSIDGDASKRVIAKNGYWEFAKTGSNVRTTGERYVYSDVQPDDVGSLTIWLDPESGVTKDGSNLISSWVSQDTNSRDFTQANGSFQPLLIDDDLNGYATVQNTGNDYLSAGNGFNVFSNTNGLYGIALVYPEDTTITNIIGKSDSGERAWRFGQRDTYIFEDQTGAVSSVASQAISATTWQIMEFTWEPGGPVNSFINGVKQSTGATNITDIDEFATATSELQVFDLQEGGDFLGKIAELVLYSDVPTAETRQGLRNYLSAKYNLNDVGEAEPAVPDVSEPNVIYVAKSGGDYTVLADALASITDATDSNRYAVVLGQGEWTEDITIPDYVYITGRSTGSMINGQVTFDSDNYSRIQNIKVSDTGTIPIYSNGTGKYHVVNCTIVSTWTASTTAVKAIVQIDNGEMNFRDTSTMFVSTDGAGKQVCTTFYLTGSNDVKVNSYSCKHGYVISDLSDDMCMIYSNNTNSGSTINVKNGSMTYSFSGTNHTNDIKHVFASECSHEIVTQENKVTVSVLGTVTADFDYFGAYIYNTLNGETCSVIGDKNDIHWFGCNDSCINIGVANQASGGTSVYSADSDIYNMSTDTFPDIGGGTDTSNGDVHYTIFNGRGSFKISGTFDGSGISESDFLNLAYLY